MKDLLLKVDIVLSEGSSLPSLKSKLPALKHIIYPSRVETGRAGCTEQWEFPLQFFDIFF